MQLCSETVESQEGLRAEEGCQSQETYSWLSLWERDELKKGELWEVEGKQLWKSRQETVRVWTVVVRVCLDVRTFRRLNGPAEGTPSALSGT